MITRRRLLRCGALALGAAAVAAVVASAAVAKFDRLFFDPQNAGPGWVVVVRTRVTPAGFVPGERKRPFQTALRLYLVPKRVASEVRSPFDPRLYLIGALVPDRSGRGVLTFAAPPLDTGDYALAAWCRQCTYRPSFRALPSGEGTLLHLFLPSARETCPVTKGRYGNGFLSTTVPGSRGIVAAIRREPDGALFQKFWWLPRKGLTGELTVRGERLDAPGRIRVLSVNWGHSSDGRGSWASALTFPSEGCWRLTGRVRDVTLTYVIKVISG